MNNPVLMTIDETPTYMGSTDLWLVTILLLRQMSFLTFRRKTSRLITKLRYNRTYSSYSHNFGCQKCRFHLISFWVVTTRDFSHCLRTLTVRDNTRKYKAECQCGCDREYGKACVLKVNRGISVILCWFLSKTCCKLR